MRPTRVRWKVLSVLCLLAGVTYLDRICISMAAPHIQRDLHLDNIQMSYVFSAFTLAYAIFEMPTGWWADRIGTRRVLLRIVVWWSAFTMATALAWNYTSLRVMRFLFGIGEAGAWPNAARTMSRWFPLAERATAQGIFFMGAHLAGGLTPELVRRMLQIMEWRMVFVIFGCVGLVWACGWWLWFRDEPEEHPACNDAERAYIAAGRPASAAGHHFDSAFLKRLGTSGNMWLLCLMYFTQSYGFYFFITWLPSYLEKVRGFSAAKLGILAGLPLLLSVVADLTGGLATDFAIRRLGKRWGRASVCGTAFFLAAITMAVGTGIQDPVASAVLIAVSGAAASLPLGGAWSACTELGGAQAGVAGGMMNTAGQVGGILSPIVLAYVVTYFSDWAAPLYFTGALYALGGLCWLLIDVRGPIEESRP